MSVKARLLEHEKRTSSMYGIYVESDLDKTNRNMEEFVVVGQDGRHARVPLILAVNHGKVFKARRCGPTCVNQWRARRHAGERFRNRIR